MIHTLSATILLIKWIHVSESANILRKSKEKLFLLLSKISSFIKNGESGEEKRTKVISTMIYSFTFHFDLINESMLLIFFNWWIYVIVSNFVADEQSTHIHMNRRIIHLASKCFTYIANGECKSSSPLWNV